jgi:hypothetical protein
MSSLFLMSTKDIIKIILFHFLQNCFIIMSNSQQKKEVLVYCTYCNKYLAHIAASLLKFTRKCLN